VSFTGSFLKQWSQILVNKVRVLSKFVSSCVVINWNDVLAKEGKLVPKVAVILNVKVGVNNFIVDWSVFGNTGHMPKEPYAVNVCNM
jgi:hypothetical protein